MVVMLADRKALKKVWMLAYCNFIQHSITRKWKRERKEEKGREMNEDQN